MSMVPRGWSISALAVELRMDRRTVAQRIADLKPVSETGRAKLYSLADVFEAIAAGAASTPTNFEDAKTRKMAADAVLAEIEVSKARGRVVSTDIAERAAAEAYAAVRAKLLGLPDKMAPLLETTPGTEGKRELLRRAVAEALEELSADDTGHVGLADDPDGEGEGGSRTREGDVPASSAGPVGKRVG
jgi:hypothetical protein